MSNKKNICYLYINGLGNGHKSLLDNFIDEWWRLCGRKLERFPVDWYSDQNIDELIQAILKKVDQLFKESDRVVLIGSSSGGSLAINAFCESENDKIFVVVSRGRLKKGSFSSAEKQSLEYRSRKSQTFFESVLRSESNISQLSPSQMNRILVMVPMTDGVVPIETMLVDEATTHGSFAFGHFGSYLAHMVADVWYIDRFIRRV